MRLEKARQMVRYSGASLTEIALAIGYASSSCMSRHYRALYGLSPQQERQGAKPFRMTQDMPPLPVPAGNHGHVQLG